MEELQNSKIWFVNRWIDLIFCCGGLAWIITLILWVGSAISPNFTASIGTTLIVFSMAMKYFLSDPHTAATWHRLFESPEAQSRWRFYSNTLTLACVALGVLAFMNYEYWAPQLLRVYTVWVMPHWMGQIYGITLIYCGRAKYKLTENERWLMWASLHLVSLTIVLETFLPGRNGPLFILQTPKWFDIHPIIYQTTLTLCILTCLAFFLRLLYHAIAEKRYFPFAPLLLYSTGILIQLCGDTIFKDSRFYVVGSYHGAQYLVVCAGVYLRQKKASTFRDITTNDKNLIIQYMLLMICGGTMIYFVIPKMIQDFFFIPFVATFPIVFCLFNFHHFITDAAIWKLRKPENKSLLTNNESELKEALQVL